ncbi:hypothetical protein [Azospirillum argentinense]|uniref:hypothetical protein n=1 Tax=Azospirillum argentinense TaxID=2970906 RepID=UPI0011F2C682|nr:hypothetical protein [Azospirillum argentinense]
MAAAAANKETHFNAQPPLVEQEVMNTPKFRKCEQFGDQPDGESLKQKNHVRMRQSNTAPRRRSGSAGDVADHQTGPRGTAAAVMVSNWLSNCSPPKGEQNEKGQPTHWID